VGTAHYPSFTTGTTITARPPLDIDPTVPRLEVVRELTTDTSITLRWNGSFEFTYELFMSELLSDYPATSDGPSGGTQIPFELILENATIEEGFIYFTVEGLFPYTLYHFWIRAINEQGRASVWSNPVSERTLDIIPPEPPSAIRVATRTSIQAYNLQNNAELRTGVPNQLLLEFMRIFADINNPSPGPVQTGYTTTRIGLPAGTASWLEVAALLSTYMVLFDELLPNRRYYIRVSTILTVTRGDSPTGIVRSYSYRMQISPTDSFLDYIEIIMPTLDPPDGVSSIPGQMRRAESVWSEIFSFFSGADDGEYDGHVNADLFPLPDRDWEIIYDRVTSTLTFRFRGEYRRVGQDGLRDLNVDQRFISRMMQQRVFVFEADLSTYNGNPVANAVMEIPDSIMRAFSERRISVAITMNNVTVTFPPDSLATPEARSAADTRNVTRLMINSGTANAPALNFGGSYASAPREVRAQVVTPTRTINYENFAEPLQLAFRLDGMAVMMGQNVGLYTATDWTGGWERVAASQSPVSGDMLFNTHSSGNFAAIALAAPDQAVPSHPSRDAFLRVNARVAITDMANFHPDEVVTGSAFNNMVAAVAMGRPSAAIYGPVSPEDTQSLTRARLYMSGAVVSREAGIAALVDLYERRTGRAVQPWDPSGPPDLASANPANHLALTKAVDLGFITGAARPTEALTMGDFMTMLDIIIMDMG
jgi:hypothetical protein